MLKPVPVMVAWVTVTLVLPVFWMTTGNVLLLPSITFPKSVLAGVMASLAGLLAGGPDPLPLPLPPQEESQPMMAILASVQRSEHQARLDLLLSFTAASPRTRSGGPVRSTTHDAKAACSIALAYPTL
jgi:hypothetical protein